MKREILISKDANEIRVSILEDGRLEEYYVERTDGHRMFGNIYKGVVKSVIPGIGACFVDLGTKKDGFLYVADALQSPVELETEAEFDESSKSSKQEEPVATIAAGASAEATNTSAVETSSTGGNSSGSRRGRGGRGRGGKGRKFSGNRNNRKMNRHKKIEEVVKVGQEVIVQVVKEPIRSKGPRLTTHFSIPARYLVMMPGDQKVGVSKRIEDRKDRERIREVFKDLEAPKGAGFIVRTAGEGKGEKEFQRDINYLLKVWKKVNTQMAVKKAPRLIHSELDLVERIIRDHINEETDSLVVDDKDLQKKILRFIGLYLPGAKVDVKFYRSSEALFEKYKVRSEIEKACQRNVFLKSGGHLVIEQTEGLVAIDVNTGKFTGNRNLEDTVFRTNMEAAREVARQLRLRDVGGIVVIDFIDMERHENRRSVFKTFKEAISHDRAKTNLLPISELGLVEMTRQRIRPSLESSFFKICPYCDGKGMVKSPTTVAIETVRELKRSLGHSKGRTINAYVHPHVSENLLSQEKEAIAKLEKINKSRIFVYPDSNLHVEDVNITFVK